VSNFYSRDEPGAPRATEEALKAATDEDAPPAPREYSLFDKAGPPPGIRPKGQPTYFRPFPNDVYPVSDKVHAFLEDMALIKGLDYDGSIAASRCRNGCRERCRCI
jgi:hypothetical protein